MPIVQELVAKFIIVYAAMLLFSITGPKPLTKEELKEVILCQQIAANQNNKL